MAGEMSTLAAGAAPAGLAPHERLTAGPGLPGLPARSAGAGTAAQLENAAHAVVGPVEHQVPLGAGQPPLRADEPLDHGQPTGLRDRAAQLDGSLNLLWTHGSRA